MKKVIVSMATACVLFISCGDIPPAMAAESSALCLSSAESPIETGVIEYEDLFCDMLDPAAVPDVGLRSTTRATNRIEWSLSAGEVAAMDTAYTLEADELVTINCTYSPRTADLDFGLITPDGTFRFTSGSNGSIHTTIRVNETGNYYFTVRNNTSRTVEVLGYVYY